VLGVIAVAALLVVSVALWRLAGQRVPVWKDTLCPQAGIRSLTVVIVDTTDSITPLQRESLRNHFHRIKSGLEKYEALQLFSVDEVTDRVPPPLIEICNPGRGEDENDYTGNPALRAKRWEGAFSNRIDEVLNRLVSTETRRESPIMETIQAAAVIAFQRHPETMAKKLVLVSDMLQNSPVLSQYREAPDFAKFGATTAFAGVAADLRGVGVELLYLGREGKRELQNGRHIEFWQAYFQACGATLTRVVRVDG
jgi:hypothetical protein